MLGGRHYGLVSVIEIVWQSHPEAVLTSAGAAAILPGLMKSPTSSIIIE